MPHLQQADVVPDRLAGLISPAVGRLLRLDPPEGLRRWVPEPLRAIDPVDALRVVLVICQAGLTIVSWKAWGPHEPVPRLHLIPGLPAVQWGWFVLATLAIVPFRPREGIIAHVLVIAVAILDDTMRVQTHWLSLAALLVATGPWRLSRTLGWAHLASLWFWAGAMKAISSGFRATTGSRVASELGFELAKDLTVLVLPAWEIALGILVARRSTRELAIGAAVVLHVGAIFVLGMEPRWAIFWWNVALVAAAPVLLRDHVSGATGSRRRRSSPPVMAGLRTAMIAALFVVPAGVLTGQVNPYLGHVLYTGMTTSPLYCVEDGECTRWPIDVSSAAMDAIQIPPGKGTYVRWFEEICRPGDELHLSGMHLRAPLDRLDVAKPSVHPCPDP